MKKVTKQEILKLLTEVRQVSKENRWSVQEIGAYTKGEQIHLYVNYQGQDIDENVQNGDYNKIYNFTKFYIQWLEGHYTKKETVDRIHFSLQDGKMKIYYQLTRRNRLELLEPDIFALLFLHEQSILSQPQLFEFYCLLNPMNESAFRRKMNRWDEAGIIDKKKHRIQDGHSMAIISLTNAGLTILKKLGFIQEKEELKYKPKKNIDHTLTIKQTVIESLKIASKHSEFYFAEGGNYIISLRPNGINFNVKEPIIIHKRKDGGRDYIPEFSPFGEYNEKARSIYKDQGGALISYVPQQMANMNGLIPDWVFQVKNDFFYIEVDSGYERVKSSRDHSNQIIDLYDVNSIEGKLYRYNDKAKKEKEDEYSHHVIFVAIDNSKVVLTTNIYSDKEKRIANLKHEIAFMNNFSKWNTNVYVVGMKRFSAIMKELHQQAVGKKDSITIRDYYNVLKMMFGLKFVPNGWKAGVVKPEQFEAFKFPTYLNYNPDLIYTFVRKVDELDQYIIPLFIREGNVLDMEKMGYLTGPVKEGKFKPDAKILAIYETKEQLTNDILRKTKNVYTNKVTGEEVNNNGMNTDDLLFIAVDELEDGLLNIYNAEHERIEPHQLFL